MNLEFANSRARSGAAGWVVLGLFLLASWQLVDVYESASAESEHLEARIEQLQRRAAGVADAAPRVSEDTQREIHQANLVIDQLALPWDRVFQAVEAAANARVSLLGVTPDPKNATVEVVGEALDQAAMFDYVRNLQRQATLSKVFLLNHQQNGRDPRRPVRFTISASWAVQASNS